MFYVSNISRPTNQKLVAKQYKISVETLKKHMSPDYKTDPKYRFYNGTHMESHLYEGIQPAESYDKLENVLAGQTNAFKVNIALGYDLVSLTDGDFTQYWHPNLANTYVFKTPVAINSRSDIRKKIISEIRSMELLTHLTTQNRDQQQVVFHCIAWYLNQHAKKDPRRIQAQVKEVFKSYRSYQGISFTLSLFRSFKPIDLLQLDDLEECFHLGINVYSMDVKTGNVESIRRSEREGVAMDILSHENHALYIKNIDMLQSKY
ncbi:unnamed protein product [Phytophthora lilii]|uniref:Unnamed protein product n=1 Tax=Phytophthora lilii TaxID=2077276 RepID=A0A9W6TA53_9STRA|nr:unnamed protein product [Phytophthora lilii]